MKVIYIAISGIIISTIASLAIAGLVSISKVVKPVENKSATVVNKHTTLKTEQQHNRICYQFTEQHSENENSSL